MRPGEQGMTLVEYVGSNIAKESWWGPVTGTRYVFGGSRKVGYVDDRDLAEMLDLVHGRRPVFKRYVQPAPAAPPPLEPAVVTATPQPPEPVVVTVTEVVMEPAVETLVMESAVDTVDKVDVEETAVEKPTRKRTYTRRSTGKRSKTSANAG